MNDRTRPQTNRTLLGVLVAMLLVAVLLALWFLLFQDDSKTTPVSAGGQALPTPLTISTPTPDPAATPTPAPTVAAAAPVVTPSPVPEGFQACDTASAPLTTATYIVDTNTTPLNQRLSPSVDGEPAGKFAAGETGLVFSGECVVNVSDGYTWWRIFNGSEDVWVASDFVTPN